MTLLGSRLWQMPTVTTQHCGFMSVMVGLAVNLIQFKITTVQSFNKGLSRSHWPLGVLLWGIIVVALR